MKLHYTTREHEAGFVLVTAMMILLLLTLIGTLMTKSTITELTISGSDKVRKQTFYQADGGSELAQYLLYQNVICTKTPSGGFSSKMITDSIKVEDLNFSENDAIDADDLYDTISDSNRSLVYYPDGVIDDTEPHTNILSNRGPIESQSGEEISNPARIYTLASQHFGKNNSESIVVVKYRLSVDSIKNASSYDCKY